MIEGTEKAISNVRDKVAALREKRAVYLAATGTMAQVANRVWNEGKLTDGAAVRYNEDYEVYGYKPPAPRKVSGNGKPYGLWKDQQRAQAIKESQGGTARKIKGGWYQSYLSFKEGQGRRDAPLELTGRLRKAYLSSPSRPDSLVDSGELEAFIFLRGEEAAKYKGLTDSKGPFLKLTEEEKAEYTKRLFDIYNEA